MKNNFTKCFLVITLLLSKEISFAQIQQIAFVGQNKKFSANMPVSINKPAGVLQNDVLIAHITSRIGSGGTVGMTPPAGWVLIQMLDSANLQMNTTAFYKVASASEPSNYSFANGGTASLIDNLGGISVYRNVNTSTPIDSQNGWYTPIGNYTTPSITTSMDSCMIVTLFASDGSTASWTAPSGMTERYDTNAVQSSWRSISSDDVLQAAMGSTGQKTASTTGGGSATGIIIALKPIVLVPNSVAEENNNLIQCNLFPNPFSVNAVLRITNLRELQMQNLKLNVYNLFGRTATPVIISNTDSFIISRKNLPSGIYFYELREEGKVVAEGKFIIE